MEVTEEAELAAGGLLTIIILALLVLFAEGNILLTPVLFAVY